MTALVLLVLTSPVWIWLFIIPYVSKYERRRQLEDPSPPTPRIITLAEKLDDESWALYEGWSPCDECGGPVVPR